MYEAIFNENKKSCPWRYKGDYFYQCQGAASSPHQKPQCKLKSCPIIFWLIEFKAGGWL